MSTTDLQMQILNKIASIKDELILEEIYKLVNLEADIDTVYTLTEAEKSN
jgi:hypothetical protein